MSLHWFTPPTPSGEDLPTILERLHPLGVRWQHDHVGPQVHYWVKDGELLAEIGAICVLVDTEEIKVYPCRGIGALEQRMLAGCAQMAFEEKPRGGTGWRYTRKGGKPRWIGYIIVGVEDEPIGRLIACHQRAMKDSLDDSLRLLPTER